MTKHTYKYLKEGRRPDDLIAFLSDWDAVDPEYIAQDAAQHYYDECDGWESTWPIKFEIFDGQESLGIYEVHLEHEPTFSAIEDFATVWDD